VSRAIKPLPDVAPRGKWFTIIWSSHVAGRGIQLQSGGRWALRSDAELRLCTIDARLGPQVILAGGAE
jgi:hypothetical protein